LSAPSPDGATGGAGGPSEELGLCTVEITAVHLDRAEVIDDAAAGSEVRGEEGIHAGDRIRRETGLGVDATGRVVVIAPGEPFGQNHALGRIDGLHRGRGGVTGHCRRGGVTGHCRRGRALGPRGRRGIRNRGRRGVAGGVRGRRRVRVVEDRTRSGRGGLVAEVDHTRLAVSLPDEVLEVGEHRAEPRNRADVEHGSEFELTGRADRRERPLTVGDARKLDFDLSRTELGDLGLLDVPERLDPSSHDFDGLVEEVVVGAIGGLEDDAESALQVEAEQRRGSRHLGEGQRPPGEGDGDEECDDR
jgi:hypothetical protein